MMLGSRVKNPLVRNRLRVFVDSLEMPANENRAGEDSP